MNSTASLGEYMHLIRVNGGRSVLGIGHTQEEAIKHAFDAASETWSYHSHIFDLLRPAHIAQQHNTK